MDDSAGPTSRPHPHHWWRIALVSMVVLVILAGGYPVGRYLTRSHPGAKSLDAAVDQLHATTTVGDAGTSFVRPAAGVYPAAGEGTERISTPPNSQKDGAVMPITVSYLPNGCWTWHIDYNAAHWHEFDYCPQGNDLLLVAQRNHQFWDFGAMKVDNVGTYACTPPAPVVVADSQPGEIFQHHCTGDNTAAPGSSTSAGPAVIVGRETITIDGTDVPTVHQQRTEELTGIQTGEVSEDWWFAVDTGLPVRGERSYRVVSGSIIGTVTYTEQGSWQLTSLTPRT